MKLKVCVLTVTYGNRFHFLKQVVERCFEEGVSYVVVVDNASHTESRNQLVQYAKRYTDMMTLLLLDENYGSAGGYKRGLEKIHHEIECDYIWLLDDDNLPEKGCLEKLFLANAYLSGISQPYALFCHRPLNVVREMELFYAESFSPKLKYNSFAGNNLLGKLPRIWNKLLPKTKKSVENMPIRFPIVFTETATYGGFFFPKSWLDIIGYPREDFFIYADDLEYTFRITHVHKWAIYHCGAAKIEDIDWSWSISSGRRPHFLLDPMISEFKLYYHFRNIVYLFSHHFKTNSFLYIVNMILWWIWLIFRALPHLPLFFKRFPLILRAIHDGHKGKLGKTF